MRRILVTAIGGDVGHSILKCLQDTGDILYGCDAQKYAVGQDMVIKSFQCKLASESGYIDQIIEKCKEWMISHLIVVSEPEIKVISENREKFHFLKLIINKKSLVDTFLDKYKTAIYLHGIGAGVPQTFGIGEKKEVNGKKYILKLRSSCGSKLLKVYEKREEIQEIVDKYLDDDLIIQEYIDEPNREYTVGVFRHKNDIRTIIFRRKLQGGFTKFVEYIDNEAIRKQAELIANSIDLEGSINIQLRIQNGKIYIFEINPRLSGTTHFRHLLGFRDVIWWLDAVDGKDIESYENRIERAIGIREMNEKFLDVAYTG